MNHKYDVFIPCDDKDIVKLPFTIASLLKYVNPKPQNIYVACPQQIAIEQTICVKDNEIFDLDLSVCKFRRPKWLAAMCYKLWQNVTQNNYYLVVDADLIFLKPLNLFDENMPIFFHAWEQCHQPYFNFMQKVYGFGREYQSSFICELMMFRKDISSQLRLGLSVHQYWEMMCNIVGDGSQYLFNDYDLYGQWCCLKCPNLYSHKKIITNMSGGRDKQYTTKEIGDAITANSATDADIMTLHTWL